jgi:hypothetical protein
MVADEIAPAPRFKGVVEREGLASVPADLEPEADHFVVTEDGRLPPLGRCALREPLRQRHPTIYLRTSTVAVQTEASANGDSKMLWA